MSSVKNHWSDDFVTHPVCYVVLACSSSQTVPNNSDALNYGPKVARFQYCLSGEINKKNIITKQEQ